MNKFLKYFVIFLLTFTVVVSCFFMPEISEAFKNSKKSYSYRTNKTKFTSAENIPYAMRFAEGYYPYAESAVHEKTLLKESRAIEIAEEFFYSIPGWKYGCDILFSGAESKICAIDNDETSIVWGVYFYSNALSSNICILVNDDAAKVIGFYTHRNSERSAPLIITDFTYYINKYLPHISNYYGWSTAYSNTESVINGIISYKIAFVEKNGSNGSVMLYYNYKNGDVIFNMAEDILSYYDISYELFVDSEG